MFKPTAEHMLGSSNRRAQRRLNTALGLQMRVDRSRHVDSSEPDASGMRDYHYEYDLYRFVEGAECLVARSYADSPQEAHFLAWELGSKHRPLQRSDFSRSVVFAAEAFLRSEGKIELNWLCEQDTYERLPERQA